MDKKINDYLTKQLYIEKNVVRERASNHVEPRTSSLPKVTFRSLSRQFKIHVNQAKKYAEIWMVVYHADARAFSANYKHSTRHLGTLPRTLRSSSAANFRRDMSPMAHLRRATWM